MKVKGFKIVAQYLAEKLNCYVNKDGIALVKMILGIEVVIIHVIKIVIIYSLALLFGVLLQTLATHVAFFILKRYSLGVHSLSNFICTILSCSMFVLVPWIMNGIEISNLVAAVIFIPIIVLLYLFAPADTNARPLVGVLLRGRMKKKAVICGILLAITTLLLPEYSLNFFVVSGAVYQCITILPITYKILKRSERNYERYENT